MKKLLLLTLLSAAMTTATFAAEPSTTVDVASDSLSTASEFKTDWHPVANRIDRNINKVKYVYKGELIMGLRASYGTISSDDSQLFLAVDNIDAKGAMATVKPFIGYSYHDNRCIGIRFGYENINGNLSNAMFDLGESNDVSGTIPNVDFDSNVTSFGLFHRSYAGLDTKGRFGLFADVELAYSQGTTTFTIESENDYSYSMSKSQRLSLMFNPGIAVYIFPNVCTTVSFGLGGFHYSKVDQYNEEKIRVGSRETSKMNFKLNLAAINFGITFHLWNKKN